MTVKKKSNATKKESSRAIQDEERNNILKIREIEKRQRDDKTIGEHVSEVIAGFSGSMAFVYIHIVWFGGWILANTVGPMKPFDPYPFTFLTLVVSLEAIFLSTFILISQNQESKMADRRNHLDLQINMLSEQENTKMLQLLKAIAQEVGVDTTDDEMEAMLAPIDPKDIAERIERYEKED